MTAEQEISRTTSDFMLANGERLEYYQILKGLFNLGLLYYYGP